MSTGAKVTLGIVIAVAVIGGGIWYWMANHPTQSGMLGYGTQSTSTDMNGMNMTATTTASATSTTTMPQGDSDQAIEQDMTSANTQMNGFSSDSASINQGMNDQPVQQGE